MKNLLKASKNISIDGEVDIYTFSGSANDKILTRLAESSDYPDYYLEPQIELFNPSGTLLNLVWDASQSEIFITLSTNGTYTLFVSDNGGDDTGDYSVFVQRTFDPGNATAIEYGQTIVSEFYTWGDVDTYSFSGTTVDNVLIRLTESSDYPDYYMEPFVELYDPAGNLVSSDSDEGQSEIFTTLSTDGIYTVLASDSYPGDDHGDYSVFVQRTFDPGNATAIEYGQTIVSEFYTWGDVDTYSFSGTTGDNVLIRLTESSDYPDYYMEPFVELYDPAGNLVSSDSDEGQSEIFTTLSTDGIYTVLASDSYPGDDYGDYSVFVQRTFNPENATAIGYGQTLTSDFSTYGDVDSFNFLGGTNDSVIIKLTEDSGYPNYYMEPFVELYGPNGNFLTSAFNDSQATLGFKLQENGSYTILASDYYPGDDYGEYSIFLFGFEAPNTETDILSYSFGIPPQTGDAIIDAVSNTVNIEVEYGTDVTDLVATFTLSDGATTTVDGIDQQSGVTANDFTNPVTYVITAEDGITIQNWIVSVDITTGIIDIVFDNFNIYPNPFSVKTTLEFHNPSHSNYKLSIFNISGSKVFEMGNITKDKIEFERGNLSEGIYLIELKGEKVFRGKMVVR